MSAHIGHSANLLPLPWQQWQSRHGSPKKKIWVTAAQTDTVKLSVVKQSHANKQNGFVRSSLIRAERDFHSPCAVWLQRSSEPKQPQVPLSSILPKKKTSAASGSHVPKKDSNVRLQNVMLQNRLRLVGTVVGIRGFHLTGPQLWTAAPHNYLLMWSAVQSRALSVWMLDVDPTTRVNLWLTRGFLHKVYPRALTPSQMRSLERSLTEVTGPWAVKKQPHRTQQVNNSATRSPQSPGGPFPSRSRSVWPSCPRIRRASPRTPATPQQGSRSEKQSSTDAASEGQTGW